MKGEYQHTLDAKGRLFIPAKLREELGEHATLTRGLDGCLFLYSEEEWRKLEQTIRELPITKSRKMQRYLISSAVDVDVDKQGRIVIPPVLRERAGLKKDVTIIGVLSRAEIWDTEQWNAYNGELDPDDVAEAMEEIGF
ncbi:MAG: division/cell wall cluster transcriptional repressor MraZ [Butyricicoccus sp.]